jgi:hypothetical protein
MLISKILPNLFYINLFCNICFDNIGKLSCRKGITSVSRVVVVIHLNFPRKEIIRMAASGSKKAFKCGRNFLGPVVFQSMVLQLQLSRKAYVVLKCSI